STYLNNKDKRVKNEPTQLTSNLHPPSSSVKVENSNPSMIGIGRKRRTRIEVQERKNLPICKKKGGCVMQRIFDFMIVQRKMRRDNRMVKPPYAMGAALQRQKSFRGTELVFYISRINQKRKHREILNNQRTGSDVAQNQRCYHMFLIARAVTRKFFPGKV
uniref:Uncharacterized protein n=1 Tax=Sus scrofa TaxID=9823 RepID=A0A8D1EA89_PIG